MSDQNSVASIFESNTLAEYAIARLRRSGLDIKKVSLVGKDYHTDGHVVGYYNTGDHVKYWGKQGAFWGGIWGVLTGSAFFFIPGIGPLVIAGPLVGAIVGTLENTVLPDDLTALGAGLYSMGIPKDSIIKYEDAIKDGKFVLIYHGTNEGVEKTRNVLDRGKAVETALHMNELAANT